MTIFPDWLLSELKKRDMSQAELARKSGVTPAQISRILSGVRGAEGKTLSSIAYALKLPPEEVYRAAGILPPKPNSDPLTEEGLYILQQLEGENKKDALRYLRMRLQVAQEKGTYNAETKAGTALPK